MVDTVIVIRHGETLKDKNNPKRNLTKRGVRMLEKKAEELKRFVNIGASEIVCTPTVRTRISARILGSKLNIPVREKEYNLRVDNLDRLNLEKIDNVTEFYFQASKDTKLPRKVPSPKTVARRFLQAIMESDFSTETLIIVSHSVALESFVKYQSTYAPKNLPDGELKYGEFIVLNKVKMI